MINNRFAVNNDVRSGRIYGALLDKCLGFDSFITGTAWSKGRTIKCRKILSGNTF